MELRLNRFFKKYANTGMWGAGVLILLAFALKGTSPVLSAVLYLAAAVAAGSPILFRAIQGLKFRVVGIEVLVSIAVLGACIIGEYNEAAVVTFLFQFGSFLEQKTMGKTRSAIKALTEMAPTTAWLLTPEGVEEIDAEDVEAGSRLLVKSGGQIAADGIVVKGEGYVNESSITGESALSKKGPGARLYAGSFLESGTLEMTASKVGEDTTFSKIIQLVEEAQDAASPAERFIDRFAKYYTPAVVGISLLFLVLTRSLDTAITVLVLACPGALVIGAPIANVAGIGRGATEGILLKGGDSIHTFAKSDTFVFDKTGTLTLGRPQVGEVISYSGDANELLSLAAGAELSSDHPLAKAIVEYAKGQGLSPEVTPDVQSQKGLGLIAAIQGRRILIGSQELMKAQGIFLPETVLRDLESRQNQGSTTVLVAEGAQIKLLLAISDGIKPDAAQSIDKLKRLGIRRLVMLTGDNPSAAAAVARKLGIPEYHAGLLPQDKVQWIRTLQQEGRRVTFVGDGINDSPALTAADTGIAMGSGTDVAIESSDVVLIRSDLSSLCKARALARKTQAILTENIAIAVGTVIALLIGLVAGFVHMSVGMLIHEGSILVVILNAMRMLIKRRN